MYSSSKHASNKGVNFGLVKHLLSVTSLQVVPRPNELCFSRPVSRSHPDGILASKSAIHLFQQNMEYVKEPLLRTGHPSLDAKSASDHIPYLVHLGVSREPRARAVSYSTEWNTRLLRDEGLHRYTCALDSLSQRYTIWEADVMARCQDLPFTPNHDVAELLYEGLKYILIHAAYVSIGSVKKFPTIATPFRKGNVGSPNDLSPQAFWKHVKAKLADRAGSVHDSPPIPELEQKERKTFSRSPFSRDRAVAKFVKRQIDVLNSTPVPDDLLLNRSKLISSLTDKGLLKSKLRVGTAAGLDALPMELVYHASQPFFGCVALCVTDCYIWCITPLSMILGLQTYIAKKQKPVTPISMPSSPDV
jgi:hypothetical protein